MKYPRVFFFAPLLACALSCAQPGVEYKPTFRAGGILADSMDGMISSLGYGYSGSTGYSSVVLGIGATEFRDGERVALTELVIAKSSFEDLDATEISGGGRYFFSSSESLFPFVSFYAQNTISDYVDGTTLNLGTQIGLQLGAGAQYFVNDQFFIDTSLRYLIPLVAGKSNTTPEIETEFSGFSLEVGIGFEL